MARVVEAAVAATFSEGDHEMKTLREMRDEAGFTRRMVGEYVGVDPTAVWYWETRRARPNEANLRKLAELYDVSIEELDVAPFRTAGPRRRTFADVQS